MTSLSLFGLTCPDWNIIAGYLSVLIAVTPYEYDAILITLPKTEQRLRCLQPWSDFVYETSFIILKTWLKKQISRSMHPVSASKPTDTAFIPKRLQTEIKWVSQSHNESHSSYLPWHSICITVAEVVHVSTVFLQTAGALLHPRLESTPVRSFLSSAVHPPRQRTAICNYTRPDILTQT